MPQLGESIHEGTIDRWLKQPGDMVQEYEPLVEVTTDKVNTDIPSPLSGKLLQILAQEGQTVPAGQPIYVMEEVGGGVSGVVAPQSDTQRERQAATAQVSGPSAPPRPQMQSAPP